MKEREYVLATDLARMQILGDILRMVNDFPGQEDQRKLDEFRAYVALWRRRLENTINVT